MDKDECYICKALEESGKYNMHGAWTDLEISKNEKGEHNIFAYGDGVAEIPCNYCPNCGRLLQNNEFMYNTQLAFYEMASKIGTEKHKNYLED